VGVGRLVIEVTELAAELFPFGVINGEKSVVDLKGVLVIYAEVGAGEFRCPAGEVFAIEKGDPGFFLFGLGLWFDFGGLSERDSESEQGREEI
jgi:hypothetical protein